MSYRHASATSLPKVMALRPGKATAAVVGVGTTRYGRFPDLSAYDLGIIALRAALADCGLALRDLDGLLVHRIPDYQRLAEMLGVNPPFAMNLQGQGRMSATAIRLAVMAVATGAARNVALVYGNNGGSAGERYGGESDRYGSGGPGLWSPYGMTSPGAFHAMMFQRHMHKYGTTSEQLATVPVTFRRHAGLNELAVMRTPFNVADHQQSRWVVEPLHLLDYCLINDGGVAMIITAADRAPDFPRPPVYINAIAQATALRGSTYPDDMFWQPAMRTVAAELTRQSDIDREDIDGLMIYDNFSPTVLFALEGFGFCQPGESGDWIQNGRIELGGEYPTNTNGGHLSESYMQGWTLNVEAVRQIRGEAANRQIAGAQRIQYMCASPVVSGIIYGHDR